MALPESLAKNMAKFQAKNNIPIFLKGGPVDKALFGVTMALCGVGVIGFVGLIYDLGFKKKSA